MFPEPTHKAELKYQIEQRKAELKYQIEQREGLREIAIADVECSLGQLEFFQLF